MPRAAPNGAAAPGGGLLARLGALALTIDAAASLLGGVLDSGSSAGAEERQALAQMVDRVEAAAGLVFGLDAVPPGRAAQALA